MKLSLRSVALLVSSFLTAASLSAQAKRGGANGGGGNFTPATFSDLAVSTLEQIQATQPVYKIKGKAIQISSLIKIARKMKVTASPTQLFLGETAVDAINYPSLQSVSIFANGWEKREIHEQRRLAVHEVLGLARIDDTNYDVSRFLTRAKEPCRTHGCDSARTAKMLAVFEFLQAEDDSCLNFDELLSLETLGDDTYKVLCGNGKSMYRMLLKAQLKKEIAKEQVSSPFKEDYEIKVIKKDE